MRFLRNIMTGLGLLTALLLAGSFMGILHPAGDALAVIRPGLAGLLALLALAALGLGARRFGAAGLVAAVLAAVPVFAATTGARVAPDRASLAVYSKNLWTGLRDTAPLLADIRAADPDLVLLQEVSRSNRGLLQDLAATYPHQHLCRFSARYGLAILSRWPLGATACSEHRSLALARVEAPAGPVWAGSVHLAWPYPYGQARMLDAAMPLLAPVGGRVVIGGDFNMVPWGHSVRRIADATGAQRIGRAFATYSLRGIPLPIDHVLSTGTGATERRGLLGSDHHGLVARIAF